MTATSLPPKKQTNWGTVKADVPEFEVSGKGAMSSKSKKKGLSSKKKGSVRGKQTAPTLENDGVEIVNEGGEQGQGTKSRKKNKTTVEEVEDEGDGTADKRKLGTKDKEEAKLHEFPVSVSKIVISYLDTYLKAMQ